MARERILIVEDNERNLRLASDILGFHGYRVSSARTAEAGLALAASEASPELILMDIQLPGMDGFAALRALRRDPATSPIPVVALTALAMKNDRERCLAAGFDGYLAKPISVRELPAQIEDLLSARSGRRT